MRSLNKVQLIGNAVKDPELKYTPSGTAIVSFSVATNREWKDSTGQAKSEATFHRVVAWSKLAEIINQYVKKGSKVFVEGRLNNKSWKDQQGAMHYMTEIVADELILLDNKKATEQTAMEATGEQPPEPQLPEEETGDVNPDDMPF